MNAAKIKALSDFLNVPRKGIYSAKEELGVYSYFGDEFFVLTEAEAIENVKDTLKEQLGDDLGEVITDWDALTEQMIEKHGRETYLAADKEENNEGGYLIYRLN